MPHGLHLPRLDPRDYFSAAELRRSERYERFLRVDWLLTIVAQLAALAVLAWRGPRIARALDLGRVGTGVMLGVLSLAIVWLATLPFGLASEWWQRRHGISRASYIEWLTLPWATLTGIVVDVTIAIAIVMLLAGRFRRLWWTLAAPVFVAIAVVSALVFPLLPGLSTHGVRDPALAGEIRRLAREEGVQGTPVKVERVHDVTTAANAMAEGIGPTKQVVLWDTLLDGRFARGEIRVVVAHELAHIAREHVWKSLAWFALFAVPGALVLAEATRRRGGIHQPGTIPFALLVLTVLQLALLPVSNVISRRYEAEADWIALNATRDPASVRGLFTSFSATSLAQPRPPTWSYVLLETHPTLLQRLAMAQAWRARRR